MKSTIQTMAIVASLALPAHSALYTSGHADYGIGYENGDFHFHFHAEGGTVDGIDRNDEEFEIPDIITVVGTGAMSVLPMDFPPLGAVSGDVVWVLPEVENMALPFLGLATEDLSVSEWGDITFSLGSVTSPGGSGEFALWQSGSFGDLLLRMSTADPGSDTLTLLPGSHAHYNYGFSEAGIWEIQMTVSGTHVTDGFKSATETLTFQVIPEPATVLVSCLGLAGLVLRRRR